MELYDVGDIIRVQCTFTGSGSVPVTPGSLSVQYRRLLDPPNSFVTLTDSIVALSTGVYYTDLITNSLQNGEYRYRFNSMGNNAAAAEKSFKLRERSVG